MEEMIKIVFYSTCCNAKKQVVQMAPTRNYRLLNRLPAKVDAQSWSVAE